MTPLHKLFLYIALAIVPVVAFALMLWSNDVGILEPRGLIGANERTLIINTVLLMLIPVIAIYLLMFFFAWWYREGNERAAYSPNWEHGILNELVWWAVPFEIVLVLGALTWTSTHELDPRRAIPGEPPMKIQVVALPWRWLFIYPEENIATLNFVRFPVDTPIQFDITADAPMNSFWIPQLGGQIYAMTGMTTRLHLIADEPGIYAGLSANYSGEGFERMKFAAVATTRVEYDEWLSRARTATTTLNRERYKILALPSTDDSLLYFSSVEYGLYDIILSKFMPAAGSHAH